MAEDNKKEFIGIMYFEGSRKGEASQGYFSRDELNKKVTFAKNRLISDDEVFIIEFMKNPLFEK